MGLFDALLGNASQISVREVESELKQILIPNEHVDMAFRLVRDLIVFTDKRLIMVYKQGVTGRKVEYHTIPYHQIVHFSIETMGNFDLDAELKIWVSGSSVPIEKTFRKDGNILDIQKALALAVLQ